MGCRQRAPAEELLRIVAEEHEGDHLILLVPDPARRKPGRGVHLHPDPACLALAERRRVFGRALRVTGVLDTGQLAGWLAVTDGGANRPTRPSKVGRPT
ncbi:MAG TPA: YlxR family protein [Rugosimonospora sp.]|nr:YlxR family protein [Rugosimonospora sp.]